MMKAGDLVEVKYDDDHITQETVVEINEDDAWVLVQDSAGWQTFIGLDHVTPPAIDARGE